MSSRNSDSCLSSVLVKAYPFVHALRMFSCCQTMRDLHDSLPHFNVSYLTSLDTISHVCVIESVKSQEVSKDEKLEMNSHCD